MIHSRSAFATLLRDLPHAATGAHGRVVAALILLLTLIIAAPVRAQCSAGWVPGVGVPGLNGSSVYATAVLPGGDVIVGGEFFAAGGVPASNIARYNPTTGAWSALGSGLNWRVYALTVLPDGDVIAGGNFTMAGVVAANLIARYNPTSGVWSSLGMALTGGAVNALAVLPDGNLIVGGRELNPGAGPAASNIARYSPSTGLWSPLGGGVDSDVQALTVMAGGDVIAGGRFFRAGGAGGPVVNGIARFNTTTLGWSALGSGVNDFGTVWALAELPGGDVVAGGRFASIGGVAASRIARYNPATGAWSALGSGVQAAFPTVYSLLVLPSGDMVVGGLFSTAGSVSAPNIAHYSPATGAWSALGSGMSSTVLTLTALPGGDAIAGGFFTTAGGPVANLIAHYRFGSAGPTIGTQPSPQVVCPLGQGDFSVTAAGVAPFTYQWQWQPAGVGGAWANLAMGDNADVGGVPVVNAVNIADATLGVRPLVAYINFAPRAFRCIVTDACGTVTSNQATLTVCAADFNCDGIADFFDYLDFVDAFSALEAAADFNGDSIIDFFDYLDFVDAFSAGC